ncbi:MAG: TolC family protein [Firmicutes bacterium]|nr:TolC family protein [Bacillota bacterium]MCM1402107.1 TolC family protein [Bacteroides sp.]MCM1477512.1 TolC family protein [Bacteroides sp.]
MYLTRRFFTIIFAAVATLGAYGMTVSLDSCRAMALRNNKNLKMRTEAVRQAGYQKDEAFAAYLPAIDFNGGYMWNQKKISVFDSDQLLPVKSFDLASQSYQFNLVKNPMTGEPVKGPDGQYIPEQVALIPKEAMTYDIHNVFFGAVTLTQPIFMGGKIVAMNKITHYAEELARAMHNSEAENIIYAVDAAYWQVVSLKAKQKLARSYVQLLDTLHYNVEKMVEQGVATRSDLLTVDVKLNQANVDLTKVDNGLVLSRMALAQVCGLPVDTQLSLADEDVELATMSAPVATSYNMADVYSRRQDLRALELGIDIFKQQEQVAKSDMLPKVALVGAYTFSNPNMFNGFKNRFNGAFSVGAMVSIPLWHWGGNYNKYRAAQSKTNIARLELENAKEMIDLQVSQSAFKAQEAMKTYEMTLSNLTKANENLRQANIGFREGVMTTDNVMEAQTAWLKANSEKVDAMIDVHLCDVYLSKVLGTLPYPTNY